MRSSTLTVSNNSRLCMVIAYEIAKEKLHDRGQPPLVNEIIAKRIIDLGKTKALNSKELVERVLASLGLPREV